MGADRWPKMTWNTNLQGRRHEGGRPRRIWDILTPVQAVRCLMREDKKTQRKQRISFLFVVLFQKRWKVGGYIWLREKKK
jgi:hypothetical protein